MKERVVDANNLFMEFICLTCRQLWLMPIVANGVKPSPVACPYCGIALDKRSGIELC